MEGSAEREIFKQLVGSRRTRRGLVFFVVLICLLYSGKIWAEVVWGDVSAFPQSDNLIPNSSFNVSDGQALPSGWFTGAAAADPAVTSAFSIASGAEFAGHEQTSKSIKFLGISASRDRKGAWYTNLPACEAGKEYIFNASFYREIWENGVYPSISIWGQEFLLNTHWSQKRFQPIRVFVTCPKQQTDRTFRFINYNPGKTFWMGEPWLIKAIEDSPYFCERKMGHSPISDTIKRGLKSAATGAMRDFYTGGFPIGVYGASRENLELIKRLAINTVIVGGEGEDIKKTIRECHRVGLRYVLSVPHDPIKLAVYLDTIKVVVRPNDVAFYVNDEPELVSFPVDKANDIHGMIRDRFPTASTCMAIVRPQACRDYLKASDFFMMDQYPIPYMPMTWLADSMDEAAGIAGRDRLVSVIQAFGGGEGDLPEWPRLPTWEEMDCLAFLSIIHGSRGIFFYTFSDIGKTEEGRQRLGRVVGRLNQIYPWLLEQNLDRNVPVKITSTYGVDPRGRPAVQGAVKMRGSRQLFLLVNTIGTYVEAELKIPHSIMKRDCVEVFSGERYPVINGTVHAKFNPYETKAFELDE